MDVLYGVVLYPLIAIPGPGLPGAFDRVALGMLQFFGSIAVLVLLVLVWLGTMVVRWWRGWTPLTGRDLGLAVGSTFFRSAPDGPWRRS